jgi:hypothetical protein
LVSRLELGDESFELLFGLGRGSGNGRALVDDKGNDFFQQLE